MVTTQIHCKNSAFRDYLETSFGILQVDTIINQFPKLPHLIIVNLLCY